MQAASGAHKWQLVAGAASAMHTTERTACFHILVSGLTASLPALYRINAAALACNKKVCQRGS